MRCAAAVLHPSGRRGCHTDPVPYTGDILDDFEAQRRAPRYPSVIVESGLVVEDRSSGFRGSVVRWNAEAVTLQDRRQYVRHFTWKSGGFVIDGHPVTLERPAHVAAVSQRLPAAGSIG